MHKIITLPVPAGHLQKNFTTQFNQKFVPKLLIWVLESGWVLFKQTTDAAVNVNSVTPPGQGSTWIDVESCRAKYFFTVG
jgi:hypothetical protein